MRVCHLKINSFLPPSETFVYHRVCDPELEHVVLASHRENEVKYPLPENVTLYTFAQASGLVRWIDNRLMSRWGKSFWYTSRVVKSHPDVIHGHFGAGGWLASTASIQKNIPLIVTLYGSDFHQVYFQNSVWKFRIDSLFQHATYLTVISDHMVDMVRQAGCPKEKLVKIRCGIDLSELPFQKKQLTKGDPLHILCVARLHPIKGVEYLLRAAKILQDQQYPFELRIIGDGELRAHLQQLSSELGLTENVHFLLNTPRPETVANFGWCHVLVLSSLMESQGIVLQEAQATGSPVIGTQVGAVSESFIDGETGFLVPAKDPQAIAEAMIKFIENPELIPMMGKKGRQFVVDRFDVQKELISLRDLYYRAVENTK